MTIFPQYQEELRELGRRASAPAGNRTGWTVTRAWLGGQRRRVAIAALGVAIAAIALFVAIATTGDSGAGAVSAREARMVMRGAAARLAAAPGTILHTISTGDEGGPHKIVDRWHQVDWAETSRPYNFREIFSPHGSPTQETAQVDGRLQLFDPHRDTIYVGEAPPPYTVHRLADGRYRLMTRYATRPATITAAQLHALRTDRDTITVYDHAPVLLSFRSTEQRPLNIRDTALAILRSAHPIVRRGTFDGRTAIEVSGPGQLRGSRNEYYVAPRTYTPLGLVQQYGGGTYVTEHYSTYELLSVSPENATHLITLTGAHPHAHVNTSPAAWRAAEVRLLG